MLKADERYALFIDIDRTLTVDDHVIPRENLEAIRAARELGHYVFINTGRSYGNIPAKIFAQAEFDGVISGNGSMADFGNERLFSYFIPRETVYRIGEYVFSRPDVWGAFEGRRYCYIYTNDLRSRGSEQIPVGSVEELENVSADDDIQVIATNKNIDPDFMKSLSAEVTFFEFDHYYDMVRKGNNKSLAMKSVINMLGIPPENTIAFGDSENDLEMLKTAGTGVAMANSQPELLEAADFITLSNYEGGVGKAIEKLLLKRGI